MGAQLTIGEILLVGEYEQQRVLHFPIVDDAVQLLPGLVYTGAIGRIDNEDQALGSCAGESVSTAILCKTKRMHPEPVHSRTAKVVSP